ncbi:MAG: VWA domain-containing protein [Bacteroidota bacterium]
MKIQNTLARWITIALLVTSCFNEVDVNPENEPYSDPNDFNTSEVSSNIPRIEISQNGNLMSVFLSITDQDGVPLENFTIGNLVVKKIVGGDSTIINEAELIELDKTSDADPIAAAVTMDYSGSMNRRDRQNMETAMETFVNLKEERDLVEVIKFGSGVETVQEFTADTTLLLSAIRSFPNVGGSTAFYSSCQVGLESANQLVNVIPTIIGFTDGGDNNSWISLTQLIDLAQEYQIPVYTVGYGINSAPQNLEFLAQETGGRFFLSPDREGIQQLYETISGQLRKLYLIQWLNTQPPGTVVVIQITTTYTAGNGTFTDVAEKVFVIR